MHCDTQVGSEEKQTSKSLLYLCISLTVLGVTTLKLCAFVWILGIKDIANLTSIPCYIVHKLSKKSLRQIIYIGPFRIKAYFGVILVPFWGFSAQNHSKFAQNILLYICSDRLPICLNNFLERF